MISCVLLQEGILASEIVVHREQNAVALEVAYGRVLSEAKMGWTRGKEART
jgi:hypothetical protein